MIILSLFAKVADDNRGMIEVHNFLVEKLLRNFHLYFFSMLRDISEIRAMIFLENPINLRVIFRQFCNDIHLDLLLTVNRTPKCARGVAHKYIDLNCFHDFFVCRRMSMLLVT